MMLAFSPLPSVASTADRSWKQSLFGRRKSLPQIGKASFIARNSRPTDCEDTLCSGHCCDTLVSSPQSDPSQFILNEDFQFCSSFGIIDRLEQSDLPLGQDQLVISTSLEPPLIDTKLHHPESAQVS